jgi:hypothetical protein
MRKIFYIVVFTTQFCFGSENNESIEKNNKRETVLIDIKDESVDPLSCCTRRASSGTYGQPDYNQVIVTRCATSTSSYQDAHARACSLAAASAERALSIAQETSESVTIGG